MPVETVVRGGRGWASARKFAETERARRAGARGLLRKRQPLPPENKLVGGRDVTSSNDASSDTRRRQFLLLSSGGGSS